MKNLLRITICSIVLTTIFSCSENTSSEDEMFLYTSEKLNLTELISDRLGETSKSANDPDYIHTELETTFQVPENLSEKEISDYIEANRSHISGSLKYLINDVDVITVEIENGIQVSISNNPLNKSLARPKCENVHDDHCDDDYPLRKECSYAGIQDCVQHAVYEEWSTYTALKCAFTGGLACIVDEAISCSEKNCT